MQWDKMENDNRMPKLRSDLKIMVVNEEDKKNLILVDPIGFAQQPISLPYELLPLLRLLDGELTKDELRNSLNKIIEGDIEQIYQPFVELSILLEKLGFTDTPEYNSFFLEYQEYLNEPVRPSVCAGSCYNEDPEILSKEIEFIFDTVEKDSVPTGAVGLLIPHIDFNVGYHAHICYASAYHSIRTAEPDLFVIFGTSHYGMSDKFMFTKKHFNTPFGTVETDLELLGKLEKELPYQLTFDELAFKEEHSIELQLIFLQYLFTNKKFKILPILVGSFEEYINYPNTNPDNDVRVSHTIEKLRHIIARSGQNVIYISSGDLSHIGRKFGDNFDAEPLLTQLEKDDEKIINNILNCKAAGLLSEMISNKDKCKVCGFPPTYSLLKILEPDDSQFLYYGQWNEKDTKSAVSFASISFFKNK